MWEYKYLQDDDMQSLLDRAGLPDPCNRRDDWEPIFPIMVVPLGNDGFTTFRIVLRRLRNGY